MSLVSIITPVYNGERFIAEAIDSVLAQTYRNWELVIVNDGSTDGTARILAGYSDPRIHVYTQLNGGEAQARNSALERATGEFVTFLDADDIYLPDALESFVRYLESFLDVDVVYSNGVMCDASLKPLMLLSDIRPGNLEGNMLEALVVSNVVTVPVCTAVRREALTSSDLRFDTDHAYGTDWYFWIQLAHCARFGYLDNQTCLYRVHASNLSKALGEDRKRDSLARYRLKIMNADWFATLSVDTRRVFFHNLLINLLGDELEQQTTILESSAFGSLPPEVQADLLRLIASNNLVLNRSIDYALQCLEHSLALNPGDHKTRLLLRLAGWEPALAARVLAVWKVAHDARIRIRHIGRRRPRPAPEALLPASN